MKEKVLPVHFIDLSSQLQGEIDNRLTSHLRDPDVKSDKDFWALTKIFLLIQTSVTTLFLIGLSATLARYFRKILHRVVAESNKLWTGPFWIELAAVVYLTYLFEKHWIMGLL